MKFGAIPLHEAEGAISAHSIRTAARVIKKGQVLRAADIALLKESGLSTVIAARLEEGDIQEDEAATRLAAGMAGPGLRIDKAFTGRVNIFAETDGVFRVSRDVLARINRVDEAITIATLGDFSRVERGRMVATIKIIPYAVHESALAHATMQIAATPALLAVHAFRPLRVGLVLTRVPGMADKLTEKTRRVTADRLTRLGCTVGSDIVCAHAADEIGAAVRSIATSGHDMVIVFGASATIDRRDMVPAGIELAGGTVELFGMPVDPGNLLLLAHIGDMPVIGAPGCARSPRENGFDWVLERLVAGIAVARDDVTAMGAGGLLMEIETRPQPRRTKEPRATAQPKRVAAILLAAGRSSRMGGPNKLVQELDGRPLVHHAARAALDSGAHPVIAVTGHMADAVAAALEGLDVAIVGNPDYADGLSTSLKRGLDALPEDVDGAMILLGDMPRIDPAVLRRMIQAFDPDGGKGIVVPVFDGKRGNPVLFARRYLAELRRLEGDVGARHLIGLHADAVVEIAADSGVLIDVDTPEALARLRN